MDQKNLAGDFLDLKDPQTDSDHQSLIFKGKCAIKHSKTPVSCENTPKLKWVCPKIEDTPFLAVPMQWRDDEPREFGVSPMFWTSCRVP